MQSALKTSLTPLALSDTLHAMLHSLVCTLCRVDFSGVPWRARFLHFPCVLCSPLPCYRDYTASNIVQQLRSEGLPYSIRQLPETLNPMPTAFSKLFMPEKPYQVSHISTLNKVVCAYAEMAL